jgi:hypothetical protein
MHSGEHRVCHVDVNRSRLATDRVQCTWSYGEGVPIVHVYQMAISRAASDGPPARDLLQSLSQ